ncbi:TPA: bifunctional phosphopantothenoylcysteine decarboxylase/phosphopantothenate--cysteine ligase CoaBC [candidate division WOR-3 bacterium]|jgi:phosphopantothenoylcysteine decarboxylase/phosphopantothenate--cysteine ligase|uniref:Coenzyme A biosynthesis bifunctional protein CoaBC n=1 Tax=candidate division WOR-3 bacterium TaxID=2052148 RepID=A0A350H9Q3_UNCW3|nr:bifunctional phosphopantothenoylcysteine decarboxylase/phosphopantothenate--cysteine ligase CoaBC [candidate division WOR-3 bacterium]
MSRVLIGITGCIAAYKAAALVREFKKADNQVKVILTKNAEEFITPLTLRTLSENQVYTSLFDDENEYSAEHIALSKWADILVVAPASANILGKFANGIADDLLSTEYLSFDKPVLIALTMNTKMYEHPAVQKNISLLKERGNIVIEPETGFLACGDEGKGRFPDIKVILMHAQRILHKSNALKGRKVIVTGGGTFEKIDPVRIIANLSSGIMADAFVKAAFLKKSKNILYIHGRISIEENIISQNISADTTQDMLDALKKEIREADILIMAAAVNDFRTDYAKNKIKKRDSLALNLKRNTDILTELSKIKTKAVKIGFALETENSEKNGLRKLKEKSLDYIVVNSPDNLGAETASAVVISKKGEKLIIKNATKYELAERVLEWIKL